MFEARNADAEAGEAACRRRVPPYRMIFAITLVFERLRVSP